MDDRTLRVLEFTKIRNALGEYAISPGGRDAAVNLLPQNDIGTINKMQADTEEAVTILTYLGYHPMIPFDDVRDFLHRAKIGSTLSPRALLMLAGFMRAARAARAALVTDKENTPNIREYASRLHTHQQLEQDIESAIISEDEISDNASPELNSIRRHMRKCNDRIRDKLQSMIHSPQYSKYLQDNLITIRNDRFVIPVKQEYRQNVSGLIHDQSSTGATLFIEPMPVVEINNELKQWIAKEKDEIERILRELTLRIAPEVGVISENYKILTQLDLIFAKGRLAREWRCAMPKINNAGYLNIIRGRHPLIPAEDVVPISLWMGREFTALVITGPNTGGKTVTLKTVGLFTLMMQSGLQIPAAHGSELAVFDDVFADIGDEQSIEQSLSTFSGHMVNIVEILKNATGGSLVLFDELGAGTDPTEGAALAQAILENMKDIGARVIATTHYSELKAYALTTPGVENASAEFDIETLRPTYRLSIGIPGKSNAFEISSRLGLPDDVISAARELLSGDQVKFEDVIANAEYHRIIAQREKQMAEEARVEMQQLRDEAEKQRARLEDQKQSIIRKAREEAKRVLLRAQQESEAIISDLRKIKSDRSADDASIMRARGALRAGLDEMSETIASPQPAAGEPPKDLKPGQAVRIVDLETKASVITPPDAKGEVYVQAGIMKLKVHISRLRREAEEQPKITINTSLDQMNRAAKMELDVRGMNIQEAISEMDIYLDQCVLSSLNEVSIIHGKGTGVLRAGIQEHLRRHPHVKNYRLGKYGEGETGVTVITLK